MTAPISTAPQNQNEEKACDAIGLMCVKMGWSAEYFRLRLPELLRMFDCSVDYRRGRIDLASITDTWEIDFGLGRDDFERLARDIGSWIVAYQRPAMRLLATTDS